MNETIYFPNLVRSHRVATVPMGPFDLKSTSKWICYALVIKHTLGFPSFNFCFKDFAQHSWNYFSVYPKLNPNNACSVTDCSFDNLFTGDN